MAAPSSKTTKDLNGKWTMVSNHVLCNLMNPSPPCPIIFPYVFPSSPGYLLRLPKGGEPPASRGNLVTPPPP